MKVLRDISTTDPALRGAAVAIGNFDGVHLGHQAVIDIARSHATAQNAPLGVMTFEPHPRQVFTPDGAAFRLMNATARANRLEKLGVDVLYELPFTPALSGLTAHDFARTILADGLGVSHVVVGADFRFGKDRGGNATTLRDFGDQMGFGVTVADLISTGESEVSSTAIRRALTEGRPSDAATMLGHWHRLDGTVIKGDQRGRDLGFPTANMAIDGLHMPRFGVYAVQVDVLTGPHAGAYNGAASIGVRPMFGTNTPNCETHLFNFKADIYGEQISVALVEYLRGEQKFASVDALVDQMHADCAQARDILRHV